jgi:hypothetical protein
MQTVLIDKPGAPFTIDSLDICPVQPENTLAMEVKDGKIFWYPDFTKKWAKDGTIYTWYKKPTFQYIFNKMPDCSYFQFNKDGSMYAREKGYYYYWDAPNSKIEREGSETQGIKLDVHVCPVANEYFLKGEECPCFADSDWETTMYACDIDSGWRNESECGFDCRCQDDQCEYATDDDYME